MPRITDEIKEQIEQHMSIMRGSDVAKKFGVADCTVSKIWKKYKERTGAVHKRKYEVLKKLTHEQIAEIISKSHVSIQELATHYGVSAARISIILKENNVGSNGSGKGHRISDDDRKNIVDSYGKLTSTEAAAQFKVSRTWILNLWKDKMNNNPNDYMVDSSRAPKSKRRKYRHHNNDTKRIISDEEFKVTKDVVIDHHGKGFGKHKNYTTFSDKQLHLFLQKCSRSIIDTDDCVKWMGSKNTRNNETHAKITINGMPAWVHTCSYVNFVGPLPDNYPSTHAMICHRCIDAGDCVNPRHLYLGTEDDNSKDRWAHQKMKELSINNQEKIINRQDLPLWQAYREYSNPTLSCDKTNITQTDIRTYTTNTQKI